MNLKVFKSKLNKQIKNTLPDNYYTKNILLINYEISNKRLNLPHQACYMKHLINEVLDKINS